MSSATRPAIQQLLLAAPLLLATVFSAPAQPPVTAIQGAAWITPEGEISKDGPRVLIRDGRIAQVGGEAPTGATIEAYAGAVLCPGLVDCLSNISAENQLIDVAEAAAAGLDASDSLNRFHPHLERALRSGVTSFVLTASDHAVVGGRGVIASTLHGEHLLEHGPVKLSLSPLAFLPTREPTSRGGAMALLRSSLNAARSQGEQPRESRDRRGRAAPKVDVDGSGLADLVAGKTPVLFTTPSAADVLSAMELAKEFRFTPVLIHNADAREIAVAIGAAKLGVIAGPYDFHTSQRDAQAAGILEKAGARVALGGGLPYVSADGLRVAAAVAVQNGMSAAGARRAITSTPAQLLGAADRIGALERGRRGDLVVFSGDPLDLRSRVLAVFVEGRCVWRETTGRVGS